MFAYLVPLQRTIGCSDGKYQELFRTHDTIYNDQISLPFIHRFEKEVNSIHTQHVITPTQCKALRGVLFR